MKEEIKISLRELTEELLAGNNVTSNKIHEIGFTISKFVIIKENMIKKCDVNGIEKTVFNVNENLDYLFPINKLADYIRETSSFINLSGDMILNGVHGKKLKDNIQIIHMVRNALAHNKYEIEDGFLKIDNPSFLVCDIPFELIEEFNDKCTYNFNKNLGENYPNNITNLFLNDKLENTKRLLYMSLYSYILFVSSAIDFEKSTKIDAESGEEVKLSFSNFPPIYSEPYCIKMSHEYSTATKQVFHELSNVYDFIDDLNSLDHHFNLNHYYCKQAKDSKIQENMAIKFTNKLKETFRSIRNAIAHANVMVGFNRFILFDTNDQTDMTSKNFEIDVNTELLFNTIRAMDMNNSYDDKFAYLHNLFTISDRSFYHKLCVLKFVFDMILSNKCYPKLEEIEMQNLDNKFTVREIADIINNFLHRDDNYDLSPVKMLSDLIMYSERLSQEYKELKKVFYEEYSAYIDEEDSEIREFDFCVQHLGLALSILNETLSLQEYACLIIDNHMQVAEDFESAKSKRKIR